MRHRVKNAELNMDTSHRKALNKYMATSFIEKGVLTTTTARAKYVRSYIERLVTKAKVGDLTASRTLQVGLDTREAVEKMLKEIAPKFKERAGGYTRLSKLGNRAGDNAQLSKLEWVEKIEAPKKTEKAEKTSKKDSKEKVQKSAARKVKKDK